MITKDNHILLEHLVPEYLDPYMKCVKVLDQIAQENNYFYELCFPEIRIDHFSVDYRYFKADLKIFKSQRNLK